MNASPPLPEINSFALAQRVGRTVGSADAALGGWQCIALDHHVINPVSGGLFRVTGTADAGGVTLPWSFVLKIIGRPAEETGVWASSDDITHWNYWRREALAYRSGLLPTNEEGGLTTPRLVDWELCQGGEEIRLWLENIQGELGNCWPVERYGPAARHLGQWQGQWPSRPLPTDPWLSRNWLRSRVSGGDNDAGILSDEAAWRNPVLEGALPLSLARNGLRLWKARGILLDGLERCPQTLCHMDLWPPNLFARRSAAGHVQTALLDWSYLGLGAAGEDIGNYVFDTLHLFTLPLSDLPRLEQDVFEGYIGGLHDAGWAGSREAARFGYAASAVLKYGFLAPALLRLAQNPEGPAYIEQRHGLPFAEFARRRAVLVAHLHGLAEEALRLLPQIT